ncbi:gliding motility-associated protein GldE [Cellulophaga baltica]|uniref:Hemolysin n=1 Tax=Cellulophaga baltica 18 TaxID=1348584 RepID=A0AAU8RAD5_9FLAO|nr:gliding motility-associated protein GldE [Cellulophaga baltica]AIY12323.1 hemolysin [Cellulophaga baltica NN016038]AIZ40686.1 hemolysin [Cellulophaga baltica 18]MBA6315405.1 gliding motility-associated protein GldE [Cellulophaga baltica]MCR1025229.1 gliding motility-associated protein GldE [Cellulophaga baltica]
MDPDPFRQFLAFVAFDSALALKLVVLFILLLCSALISGAEVAYFGLSASEINAIDEEKTAKGGVVVKLLEKPKKLLATILIANNAINIAIVLLFSAIGDLMFEEVTYKLFGFLSVRFLLEVVVVTFLILMFGEILPKVYANRNQKSFAYTMSYPLKVLDVIFTPLSAPMRSITLFLHKKLGKQKSSLSVDQLSQALELTSEGDTTKEEQKILEGIVSFGNTDTKQVMRPRIDIFALNVDMKFLEVIEEIKKRGYSRVPVFAENVDNVKGVLYVKDLLPYIDRKTFNWMTLVREPYFVPENKKLDDLLLEFQEKKNHLAVVVDEYGGTSGIVTLEDIIEEIVGDISDEFDDEDLIFSKLDDNKYLFDGKTALKDFYRVIKIDDETNFEERKGESETIAGFILEIAGSFPKRGEVVEFDGFTFVIESLDKKRLKQIKVILPNEE